MDYPQSLAYLYSLQRFGIKLGLYNIRTLLKRLGHPEGGLRIVHVGGTNGKGSVSAATALMLQAAGYRTGMYTSPHLHAFTERVRIDGRSIAPGELVDLVEEIRTAAGSLPVTFFEFTTALALLYFQRQQVQYAVLEVGMGGRLDATNAVLPQVTVITPICCDHAEFLGPDLAAIAGEKAGIIKPGVPVIIGPQDSAAQAVLLGQAARQKAPVRLWERDFRVVRHGDRFDFMAPGCRLAGLFPALAGDHQIGNMALALAAATALRSVGGVLPDEALRAGVERVRWPGRLEWWQGEQRILLDGAHNEGGARGLADYLAHRRCGRVHWVVAVKGPRQPREILTPLLPFCARLYGTLPPVDSGVPTEELVRLAREGNVPAEGYATPEEAVEAALKNRAPDDVILIAGSLYLVAAAREYLMNRERVGR
jgi:dihydrofolate synthase/folylpolyglutamate synthase